MMRLGGIELETLPGLTHPLRRLSTGVVVQPIYYGDDAACGEAWADQASIRFGGRRSAAWRQNMEIDLVRSGAPVWPMLDEEYHVRIIPRNEYLSMDWAVWRSLDHGVRHPTCCAWAAVHRNRDRYFFRQYYATDTPIPILAKQILDADGEDEGAVGTVADSQLWQRDPKTLKTYEATYWDLGLPLLLADKSRVGYETLTIGFLSSVARWALGHRDIDVIRDMMGAPTLQLGDVERIAAQPAIWFHPACAQGPISLFEQCRNLRYKEHHNVLHTAEPELPEDKEDEGPDVVRYMCQTPVVQWVQPQRKSLIDIYDRLVAMQATEAKSNRW